MVSKIAIGTVQFGVDYGISNSDGVTSPEEVSSILAYGNEVGIDTLDTAYAYGKSESTLGNCDLKPFNVISKFPDTKGKSLKDYFSLSLDRLNQDSLYGYIAHNADAILDNPHLWEELEELKQNGSIQKIGYSLYSPSEYEKLMEREFIPDLIQIPYNILDNRFQPYFSELKERQVEIHTRSCFLQGLMFLPYDELGSFFDPVKNVLRAFDTSFEDIKSKISFLLNYVLNVPEIDKVVLGVNNLRQLKENLSLVNPKFSSTFSYTDPIPEHVLLPYNWPKK